MKLPWTKTIIMNTHFLLPKVLKINDFLSKTCPTQQQLLSDCQKPIMCHFATQLEMKKFETSLSKGFQSFHPKSQKEHKIMLRADPTQVLDIQKVLSEIKTENKSQTNLRKPAQDYQNSREVLKKLGEKQIPQNWLKWYSTYQQIINKMEKQNKKKDSTSGRWTRAEHEKFMEALEKYGRDWVKVQKKIKTRTLLQIRSHAQKVFLNMSENDIKAFIGSDDESFSNNVYLEDGLEKMESQEMKTNYQEQQIIQKNVKKNENTTSSPKNTQSNIKLSPINHKTKILQSPKLLIFKSQFSNKEQNGQGQNFESVFFQMLKKNQDHFLSGGDFLSLICKDQPTLSVNTPKLSTF